MLPTKYSFKYLSSREARSIKFLRQQWVKSELTDAPINLQTNEVDDANRKRMFLKLAGIVGLGAASTILLPKKASALVFGSTPASNVVGLKDASNARINPATDETLADVVEGKSVSKKTISLSASGVVHTPTSGTSIRLYSLRFSLSANLTDVSFRFTSGGTDFEKYIAPKTGGLYGSNNHPDYVQGAVDEVLYCVITGTGTIQVVIDYKEI